MSDTKKYLCGAEKRKKKQEKQFTSKLTKITGFFTALNPGKHNILLKHS